MTNVLQQMWMSIAATLISNSWVVSLFHSEASEAT